LFRDDEGEKELLRAIELGGEEVNLAHRYLGALYSERVIRREQFRSWKLFAPGPKAKDAEQIREIIKGLRIQTKMSVGTEHSSTIVAAWKPIRH